MITQKTSNEYLDVTREFTNRFKSTSENRLINHSHVAKIKEQMKNSLSNFPPININRQTNNIIDGQHRLKAFQKLIDEGTLPIDAKLAVMYSNMAEEVEREAIINANTNSKNWSLDDYMSSYAFDNIEYRKLDEWAQTHTLCFDGKKTKFRYAAAMLKRQNCTKQLKDGTFNILPDDYIKGEEIHDELIEILSILEKPLNGNFIESITLAWANIRQLHTFKDWLRELKLKKVIINKKPFANKKDWDIIFSMLSTSITLKK
jgi:hypothetical protein